MAVKSEKKVEYIKIKLIKSKIGRSKKQRDIVKGLGLRRINSQVVKEKRPEIMGMVKKVEFMLEVREVAK